MFAAVASDQRQQQVIGARMNKYAIYLINALLAGIISGGGAYLASDGSEKSMVIAGVTALISAAKDFQSHMQVPPE